MSVLKVETDIFACLSESYRVNYDISDNVCLVKIDATDRLVKPSRLTRNMGQHSFQILSCNTIIRKESFYPRTIRDWNALPTDTATAKSLESFKTHLIKLIKLFLLAHLFCTALYC